MLKTRIILIVVSAALIIFLFNLPKVVIDNDNTVPLNPVDSVSQQIDFHVSAPEDVLTTIKNLRAKFVAGSGKEKNAIFADSLADLYNFAGKFDSAAWFAEEASKFFYTTESWIKTGDQYYQAFTFALDAAKQKHFASRAQAYYNKVLDKQPGNLEVKTKLAMTYLIEPSPMQAIAMLKEVVAQDPENELALYNLGMLSIQSGQHKLAVERLQELVRLNPDHTQGHLLLGIALMNSGNKKRAKEQFEKVKLLDKDPAVQAAVDSYLKDLK